MKLCVFGSGEIGAPTLETLARAHTVVAVVTQPDRPQGRGQRPAPTPIKTLAQRLALPVLEPVSARDPRLLADIRRLRPDLLIVMAYGGILPPALLQAAPYGAWNLHPSLLPKYRGAAPIPWTLYHGDAETGLTMFQMDAQVDHGPIVAQQRIAIEPDDTTRTLSERIGRLAPDLLLRALAQLEAGRLTTTPQDDRRATPAPRLTKADGWMDWSLPAAAIVRRGRAVLPWPGCTTSWQGHAIKVLRLTVASDGATATPGIPPGTVRRADEAGIVVQAGQGTVIIHELQLAGGRALDAAAFLRGHRLRPDDHLG
ncbi:MAG: methionyl-tRNA formyltransferase [Candidatus Omnitrophica bacterium]|nr:methionyl-tRNA formyltransferase [Candidatus Omnitrophota bacterium]